MNDKAIKEASELNDKIEELRVYAGKRLAHRITGTGRHQ